MELIARRGVGFYECSDASGSVDRSEHVVEDRVWNVAWRPQYVPETGENDSFNKDTFVLASCGGRSFRLWELSTSQENGSTQLDSFKHIFKSPLRVSTEAMKDKPLHHKSIRRVHWDMTGRLLSAASFDATVSLWEVSNEKIGWNDELHWGKCTESSSGVGVAFCATVQGHQNEVKAAPFAPRVSLFDNVQLATCSRDKSVWIHHRQGFNSYQDVDVDASFMCDAVLQGHSQDVKSVIWMPLPEWSREIFQAEPDSRYYSLLQYGECGETPLIKPEAMTDTLISCSYDESIRVWSKTNPDSEMQCLQVIESGGGTVWDACARSCGCEIAVANDDGLVRFFSDASGHQKFLRTLRALLVDSVSPTSSASPSRKQLPQLLTPVSVLPDDSKTKASQLIHRAFGIGLGVYGINTPPVSATPEIPLTATSPSMVVSSIAPTTSVKSIPVVAMVDDEDGYAVSLSDMDPDTDEFDDEMDDAVYRKLIMQEHLDKGDIGSAMKVASGRKDTDHHDLAAPEMAEMEGNQHAYAVGSKGMKAIVHTDFEAEYQGSLFVGIPPPFLRANTTVSELQHPGKVYAIDWITMTDEFKPSVERRQVDFLATACSDGHVRVFSRVIKVDADIFHNDVELMTSSFATSLPANQSDVIEDWHLLHQYPNAHGGAEINSVSWYPTTSYLSIAPSDRQSSELFDRQCVRPSDPDITGTSHKCLVLASGGDDGTVSVWQIPTK